MMKICVQYVNNLLYTIFSQLLVRIKAYIKHSQDIFNTREHDGSVCFFRNRCYLLILEFERGPQLRTETLALWVEGLAQDSGFFFSYWMVASKRSGSILIDKITKSQSDLKLWLFFFSYWMVEAF